MQNEVKELISLRKNEERYTELEVNMKSAARGRSKRDTTASIFSEKQELGRMLNRTNSSF